MISEEKKKAKKEWIYLRSCKRCNLVYGTTERCSKVCLNCSSKEKQKMKINDNSFRGYREVLE